MLPSYCSENSSLVSEQSLPNKRRMPIETSFCLCAQVGYFANHDTTEHLMRFAIRVSVLLFLSLLGLPLLAQNASVNGQVLDPQRAALAGAAITLTNADTNVSVHTKTGAGGTFILPPLAPGHYKVKVSANGFTPSVINDVTLEIGESKTLNITMRLDSVLSSISVSAAPPELNTDGSDRSLMIEPTFVQSIPLNIRNPLQLINFSAGVTKGDDGLSGQDATSESRTNTFRINGAKGSTTDVSIDGATNTTAYYNQDAGIPGVESVQEFRVYTDAYAPEFGRTSGGSVSYALHTGTDQFHGSVSNFSAMRISTPTALTLTTQHQLHQEAALAEISTARRLGGLS